MRLSVRLPHRDPGPRRLETWTAVGRTEVGPADLAARDEMTMLRDQGRSDEAIRVLEGLMYVNPFKADAHRVLGDLYLDQGSSDKALREYRVFLGLEPSDMADAHYRVARALKETGEPERKPSKQAGRSTLRSWLRKGSA